MHECYRQTDGFSEREPESEREFTFAKKWLISQQIFFWEMSKGTLTNHNGRAVLFMVAELLFTDPTASVSFYVATALKYSSLLPLYFTLIAVETLGAGGESALDFREQLGRRIARSAVERRSFLFLIQRLSIAVQRENAVCVTGTALSTNSLDNDIALLSVFSHCCCFLFTA